ncbi:MAG TPA: hypothetical protein VHA33_02705 [Candidatus Angelobacter sp.]|jgi:hypothetical protein|nr:hypothetical protein [Candidatus Angelobacter sp.]
MIYPQDLCSVAERVIWFEGAEDALRYPRRFLAYLMTYGNLEDLLTAKKYFSDADFEAALLDPPPGIFDAHSWNYWNIVYNRVPVPPLPERKIP